MNKIRMAPALFLHHGRVNVTQCLYTSEEDAKTACGDNFIEWLGDSHFVFVSSSGTPGGCDECI